MFSKAKRFNPLLAKAEAKDAESKKNESEIPKQKLKILAPALEPEIPKPKPKILAPALEPEISKPKLKVLAPGLEPEIPKPKPKILAPALEPEISKPKPKVLAPGLEPEIPKPKPKILAPALGPEISKPKPKVLAPGLEPEIPKPKPKVLASAAPAVPKLKQVAAPHKFIKSSVDTQSVCSSRSAKSFVTPKPTKTASLIKAPNSLKKPLLSSLKKTDPKLVDKVSDDIIKAQEAEIRNKDYTITEYSRQLGELKGEIAKLQKELKETPKDQAQDFETLNQQISQIHITDKEKLAYEENSKIIQELEYKISSLEQQCEKLEHEVSSKQVELQSVGEIITIRDSLCKDLQDKLTNVETNFEATKQRHEMVKGHHALALEANESIRREYKAELETMKVKLDDEKQAIINKCKADQEAVRSKYSNLIETIKEQLIEEKNEAVKELQNKINNKDKEIKAKLEQIHEATREKLRLCEIQFEERCRTIQNDWLMQEEKIQYLEKEEKALKYSLDNSEERNTMLKNEINMLRNNNKTSETEKSALAKEIEDLKDKSKKKFIEFENQINKLTVEVEKAMKEKNRFEMSLNVTRDIVQVLTMRLRESDDDVEHLEGKVQTLIETKEELVEEIANYKSSLSNTMIECNEYKEALVNILKSKAALAKEHTRIMEHNVSLIESLQNVEKEAFRELGSIKCELIEDVELLKKESTTQIKMLHDEVEKKRLLCELAKEHAGQATAAAEQSRVLLGHAAAEISRLETENQRLTHQIQDQQSLVVELSLLRQENEELTLTVAKQSSQLEKMKKDKEQMQQIKPKSPSVMRKNYKIGKENSPLVISPLRERNH